MPTYDGLTREELIEALEKASEALLRSAAAVQQKQEKLEHMYRRSVQLTNQLMEAEQEVKQVGRVNAIALTASAALATAWLGMIEHLGE